MKTLVLLLITLHLSSLGRLSMNFLCIRSLFPPPQSFPAVFYFFHLSKSSLTLDNLFPPRYLVVCKVFLLPVSLTQCWKYRNIGKLSNSTGKNRKKVSKSWRILETLLMHSHWAPRGPDESEEHLHSRWTRTCYFPKLT